MKDNHGIAYIIGVILGERVSLTVVEYGGIYLYCEGDLVFSKLVPAVVAKAVHATHCAQHHSRWGFIEARSEALQTVVSDPITTIDDVVRVSEEVLGERWQSIERKHSEVRRFAIDPGYYVPQDITGWSEDQIRKLLTG